MSDTPTASRFAFWRRKRVNSHRLLVGSLLVITTILCFTSANLWSENQSLRDQVSSSQKSLAAYTNVTPTASPSAEPVAEDVATGVIPPLSATDYAQGNRSAKVYLIEYSDLECPYCRVYQSTLKQLQSEYGDKLVLVFRNYPIQSLHQNAPMEAKVADCVAQTSGETTFFTYIDTVFSRTQSSGTSFTEDQMVAMAQELGSDPQKVKSCVDNGGADARITKDIADGTKAGVRGTPATFVMKPDGTTRMISGAQAIDTFRQEINALLN